jgi:hypothetical protein
MPLNGRKPLQLSTPMTGVNGEKVHTALGGNDERDAGRHAAGSLPAISEVGAVCANERGAG